MEKKKSMKNPAVEKIAIYGIIIALIAVMTFVPQVGYVTIGLNSISITTIHIVVILFAWMFGWKKGFVAGLAFGFFSMLKAIVMPVTVSDPAFQNPLISVLPRVLFGVIAGLTFDLLRFIRRPSTRFWLDVLMVPVLTILHTVLVLVMYFSINNVSDYTKILGVIISLNGLLEIGAATVLVPLLILPLDKAFPQYEAINHGTLRRKQKGTVYDVITQQYHDDLLQNLNKFVAINSVYDDKTANKENPFGKGVTNALNFIANLAKDDGFEVTNYNNMVVEITCGEGKNVTILAHADVVPEGTGWDQNPFSVVDHDEYLTGRGVADDKGPLLAAYYAMKAVRDNHLLGDYQIRFIVGGNEESGSRGVEYYFQKLKKPQPDFGFSPDSEFPLIFAEKGIFNFEVKKKLNIKYIDYIKGGVAANSVIERCEVGMDYDNDFITYLGDHKYNVSIEQDNKKMTVVFHGKAAHGSTPEEGVNAGMAAIKALAKYLTNKDLLQLYAAYSNLQGYGLEAFGNSEEMGHNTLNVGLISLKDKEFSMTVNFRYVDKCDVEQIKNNIKLHSKPFNVTFEGESKLLHYPKESVLVQTLLNAYRQETGDMKSEPKAIGGGTYAKEADNVLAFGAEFPGWDSKMHGVGEQVKKADLFKSVSIYAKAIVDLGKKLEERNEN